MTSLWDPGVEEKKPASQVEDQLNAAEAKGWKLVLVIPRHRTYDDLYADDADPEGPWLVLHKKSKD